MLRRRRRMVVWLHTCLGLLIVVRGLGSLLDPTSADGVPVYPQWLTITVSTLIVTFGALEVTAGVWMLQQPSRGPFRVLMAMTAFWTWLVSRFFLRVVLPEPPPMSTEGPLQDSELVNVAVTVPHLLLCLLIWYWLDRWAQREFATPPSGRTV